MWCPSEGVWGTLCMQPSERPFEDGNFKASRQEATERGERVLGLLSDDEKKSVGDWLSQSILWVNFAQGKHKGKTR